MLPRNKDYDKKIFRIVSILNKLDANKQFSSSELSRDFNVSLRTIQRDIELLGAAGFPLVSPEKGLYAFQEGFSLKQMKISSEEASLLSFLYEIAKTLGGNFKNSFLTIMQKVLQKGYDSPFYMKVPEGVKLDKSLPFVKKIESAIDASQKLEIVYLTLANQERKYTAEPLKIIYFDGFWYLLTKVEGRSVVLKLRIERMKDVRVLNKYFEPPKNLMKMLEQSVNIWFSEKRDKKAVLKVDKDAAHFFKQKVYFPLQKITKQGKDGSLVLETKVSQYEEILHTIMHWIPDIEVLQPKELKIRIRKMVQEYLKKKL